jgi:hypothetical protein
VKVAIVGHSIDGKGLMSRENRQNRSNRRYLPTKCHKISILKKSRHHGVGRGGTTQYKMRPQQGRNSQLQFEPVID